MEMAAGSEPLKPASRAAQSLYGPAGVLAVGATALGPLLVRERGSIVLDGHQGLLA